MTTYDPNFKQVKQYAIVGQKVVIVNDQHQILLLQRSERSGAGGMWSLVGGGLEQGEKAIVGLLREIDEEVQVKVSDIKPFYVRTYQENADFIVIIAYEAKYQSGEIILNWEHDDYEWLTKEQALTKNLTQDARDIIERW